MWTSDRQYEDRALAGVTESGGYGQLYYDPPMSEWCANCRMRQSVSEEYRQACRAHGGALRGLMRRGKTLAARARQMREGA